MNPKLGILLSAVASLGGDGALPTYYRPKTYEHKKIDLDRVTNPGKVAQSVSTFVQGGASNACAGVNRTITSTGTTLVTMTCTGTVNFSSWGPGLVAASAGGQFAKSALSVTNGQVWVAYVALPPASGAVGHPSFWCPQAQTNCTTAQIDPGNSGACATPTGLSTSNFVCAASGNGGTNLANSVGTTKFHGGSSSGPGGGAGGPDGNGNNDNGTTGGSGDAGLGGAGGTGAGNGVSNALGGGGGGFNGLGGAPGGASGAYGASGSRGQDVVHGWLLLPPNDEGRIQVAGSGYGGGTISAA